jgi:hypothetical protein
VIINNEKTGRKQYNIGINPEKEIGMNYEDNRGDVIKMRSDCYTEDSNASNTETHGRCITKMVLLSGRAHVSGCENSCLVVELA